jgi:hypothetical protein
MSRSNSSLIYNAWAFIGQLAGTYRQRPGQSSTGLGSHLPGQSSAHQSSTGLGSHRPGQSSIGPVLAFAPGGHWRSDVRSRRTRCSAQILTRTGPGGQREGSRFWPASVSTGLEGRCALHWAAPAVLIVLSPAVLRLGDPGRGRSAWLEEAIVRRSCPVGGALQAARLSGCPYVPEVRARQVGLARLWPPDQPSLQAPARVS